MLGRRSFLHTSLLAAAAASAATARIPIPQSGAHAINTGPFGIPGMFRGRVVAVEHPHCIAGGHYQAKPVREMIERGMMELTGAPAATDAWRLLFQPGDVVGIKLNPAGLPHIMSAPEVLHALIDGLKSAGVPAKEVVVYDRYRRMFLEAGYDKWLPEGARWAWATDEATMDQLDMDGYDAEHYMETQLVAPGGDPSDPHHRRSYVAKFLTQQVSKMINVCHLKHHQSAGVTIALKNMSYGLVNNVYRSHSSATLNTCGTFIPAVCDVPVIRRKVALNICDAVKAAYHGGPGRKMAKYIFEHKTMYFATDPVALDRVGLKVIDAKRVEKGMLPVAEAKPDADSSFVRMQPEHIEVAGVLGLGEADEKKIDMRKISLG